MSRLFISHSSQDKEAVHAFVEFLVLGMGISREDIFCTSLNGTLPAGQFFIERIRAALQDCRQVLCFLTPNYMKSVSCVAELGAAWIQTSKIIPLLVPPMQYSDFNNTPLLGMQMLRLDRADLMDLYDQLCVCQVAKSGRTAEFDRQLKAYLQHIDQPQLKPSWIAPDAYGYYRVKITSIRSTPPQYRCYKLESPLQLQEKMVPGESHWIFFKAGMYEDLAVGDTVAVLVGSTKLHKFPDIGYARNIYPDELKKLSSSF